MKNTNSKIILSIGFGSILVLLVIMTAIWLVYIQDTNTQVEKMLQEQSATALVFRMRDSAHQRTLILHRIALLSDTFDRDEEYMQFNQLASDFIKARDELFKLGIVGMESKVWESAKKLIFNGGKVQLATIEHFLEDRDIIARNLLLNQVTQTQKEVMSELTKMLDIQRLIMRTTAKKIVTKNKRTYHMVSVLGIVIFLLGSAVAIFAVLSSERNEKKLIGAQEEALSASQYKSLFLANMSHEIRTPLTVVIGYAETLLNPNLNTDNQREYIATIIRNGKHLLQIINDILDLSKIEANKLEVEIRNITLLDILEDISSVMGKIAREKGLEFKLSYLFPLPIIIESDSTRLKQILFNITSNAIKFTEQGSIVISCNFGDDSGMMHFSVVDTGIGMENETIEDIFNSFSQADSSTTRKYGGTGLGLAISRELAVMLGGELKCTSVIDEGTKFELTINPGEIDSTTLVSSLPENWSLSSSNDTVEVPQLEGNILLAEDSPDIQGLVTIYIERTGASVTKVENGQLAIEQAIASDFDLILMDMQMPIMGGLQATQWLRSTGYDGKIVALTANAMNEDRDKYSQAGIDDFLAKPIDLALFYDVVSKYLKQRDNTIDAVAEHGEQASEIIETVHEKKTSDINDLILNFKNELLLRMSDFDDAIENLDLDSLREEAHKLKGIATSFGFPELTDLAAKIEVLAKEQNLLQASELFIDLDEICKGIVN